MLATHVRTLVSTGSIRSVYQPVVDLQDGAVRGYEALSRGPAGHPLERPDLLFGAAREAGLVPILDWVCRTTAFAGALAAGMTRPMSLFVNAEPEALATPCPPDLLPTWALAYRHLSLVMELTERQLVRHPAALLQVVEQLRELGCAIALDDVGAHPDSLTLMPILEPDVIKLDLRLVQQGLDRESAAVLHAVAAQAERTGAVILAEGIETPEQLRTARAYGATLGQGWLLGRPVPEIPITSALTSAVPILAPLGGNSRATPYERVSAVRTAQRGDERLLATIAWQLEEQAVRLSSAPVVLAAVQTAQGLSGEQLARYTELARQSAFVGVLGRDVPDEPAPGVQGAAIAPGDPLGREWTVVVIGAHFAGALVSRQVDSAWNGDKAYSFVLTHDRDLVLQVARFLMGRLENGPTERMAPSGTGGLRIPAQAARVLA